MKLIKLVLGTMVISIPVAFFLLQSLVNDSFNPFKTISDSWWILFLGIFLWGLYIFTFGVVDWIKNRRFSHHVTSGFIVCILSIFVFFYILGHGDFFKF